MHGRRRNNYDIWLATMTAKLQNNGNMPVSAFRTRALQHELGSRELFRLRVRGYESCLRRRGGRSVPPPERWAPWRPPQPVRVAQLADHCDALRLIESAVRPRASQHRKLCVDATRRRRSWRQPLRPPLGRPALSEAPYPGFALRSELTCDSPSRRIRSAACWLTPSH